jgi:hypothetical protein
MSFRDSFLKIGIVADRNLPSRSVARLLLGLFSVVDADVSIIAQSTEGELRFVPIQSGLIRNTCVEGPAQDQHFLDSLRVDLRQEGAIVRTARCGEHGLGPTLERARLETVFSQIARHHWPSLSAVIPRGSVTHQRVTTVSALLYEATARPAQLVAPGHPLGAPPFTDPGSATSRVSTGAICPE